MRIRWTEPAVQDLTQICDYLGEQGGAATARRVALAIYQRIDSLAQLPYQGRRGRAADTRELVVSSLPYLVVYRIREDAIEINRILHGAQRWP